MEQTEEKKINWLAAFTALFVSTIVLMIMPMLFMGYEGFFKEAPDYRRAFFGGIAVDVFICTLYAAGAMTQDLYKDFIKD